MHKNIFIILIMGLTIMSFRSDEPKIFATDLAILSGKKWTGTLTYLDYRSKKEVSIPVSLTVNSFPENSDAFIFIYDYTNEPGANGSDTIKIIDSGSCLGIEKVIPRSELLNNTLGIITEELGEDDDCAAIFRHSYLISDTAFSIKKEVRFLDENEFFKRNVYEFKRTD